MSTNSLNTTITSLYNGKGVHAKSISCIPCMYHANTYRFKIPRRKLECLPGKDWGGGVLGPRVSRCIKQVWPRRTTLIIHPIIYKAEDSQKEWLNNLPWPPVSYSFINSKCLSNLHLSRLRACCLWSLPRKGNLSPCLLADLPLRTLFPVCASIDI